MTVAATVAATEAATVAGTLGVTPGVTVGVTPGVTVRVTLTQRLLVTKHLGMLSLHDRHLLLLPKQGPAFAHVLPYMS